MSSFQKKKKKNLKQLIASVLKKKRSKTNKRLKKTLFNWTKKDKACKFSKKSSFSSYIQHKNKQLIQLILSQLDAQRLVEGKGHDETD